GGDARGHGKRLSRQVLCIRRGSGQSRRRRIKMGYRIAVDAMGSDAAPAPEVAGTLQAAREWPDLRFVLVGDEGRIRAEAEKNGGLQPNVEVVHTTQVITPGEEPTKA